jgi:uncharacterized membrane-anchored protein
MKDLNDKVSEYFKIVDQSKQKYLAFEEELNILSEYIEAVVQGKKKGIKYYPA